jgi:hypothetical protein
MNKTYALMATLLTALAACADLDSGWTYRVPARVTSDSPQNVQVVTLEPVNARRQGLFVPVQSRFSGRVLGDRVVFSMAEYPNGYTLPVQAIIMEESRDRSIWDKFVDGTKSLGRTITSPFREEEAPLPDLDVGDRVTMTVNALGSRGGGAGTTSSPPKYRRYLPHSESDPWQAPYGDSRGRPSVSPEEDAPMTNRERPSPY